MYDSHNFVENLKANCLDMSRDDLRRYCLDWTIDYHTDSLYLEFGVSPYAESIRLMANHFPDRKFYGFDSFEGLQEEWWGNPIGMFAGSVPEVPDNVELVIGMFDETLPSWSDQFDVTRRAALIHVDCDLGSSTRTIFNYCDKLINTGTIILFDEIHSYPGWEDHEFAAFNEFLESSGHQSMFFAWNSNGQQAACVIL